MDDYAAAMSIKDAEWRLRKEREDQVRQYIINGIVVMAPVAGALTFAALRLHTSHSHEWLVRTGLGVADMQIGKRFIAWPFQRVQPISMVPRAHHLTINAMSREKMQMLIPFQFTVGVKNDRDALTKYARFLLHQGDAARTAAVLGVIEGEARTLAANLDIEQIFVGRTEFKGAVVEGVQTQLEQFGLHVYSANIEELSDSDGSNYFGSLSQRIKSHAENTAIVEVAEQNKRGAIGAKERDSETRQRVAEVEAEARKTENERTQAVLQYEAQTNRVRAEAAFVAQSAQIKADTDALKLRAERDREVQVTRVLVVLHHITDA